MPKTKSKVYKTLFGTMLGFGIIGLIASFVLAVEEFHLLKDADAILSCSFNVVLNCSTVMQTWQATVFGFPNMFIGLMAFPVVILVATLGLVGADLPRWFWRWANVGFLLGALFAYWLFFNSVYAIEVLCPWCLIVTLTTTVLLSTITRYNLLENNFSFKAVRQKSIQAMLSKDIDKVIIIIWLMILISLVFLKFGSALFA